MHNGPTAPIALATARPNSPAIAVRGVSKAFRLPHERVASAKHLLLSPRAHRRHDVLQALEDVGFDVAAGECFGIVGRNGSGKSTLLKCLAGIYRAEAGTVTVEGRLAPFIELGVGFSPELTARDNCLINAVLLGLSPAQARERFDAMIAFAELEEFVDLKVKNFSSGMALRLAFAVTTQVDADVLLFDEVIAVGDAAFEAKCLSHLEQLREEGRTVVLVTHDMDAIRRNCDRGLLLDRGRVAMVGEPEALADAYEQVNTLPRGAVATHDDAGRGRHRPRPRARSRRTPTARELAALRSQAARVVTLTRVFAGADFKLKYLDARLSYLWVLVRPLAFFGTLLFVFTEIGHLDQGVAHYPVYLFGVLLLWFFFADATALSVYALVAKEPVLRRVPFPHVAVPLSVVATALVDLAASTVPLLVLMLASGIEPRWSWLEVIPILVLYVMLVAGTALLLAALYVRFRDVDHIWALGRQILFYASPIFYVAMAVPSSVRPVLAANPLAAAYTELRHAVIDPTAPSAVAVSGGWGRAAIPVLVVLAVFVLGLWVFRRESPSLAEDV